MVYYCMAKPDNPKKEKKERMKENTNTDFTQNN